MIFTACGTQQSVVRTAPVAPIASTIADAIVDPLGSNTLTVAAAANLGGESADYYSCVGVTVMTRGVPTMSSDRHARIVG
jgi:hypothetical protein